MSGNSGYTEKEAEMHTERAFLRGTRMSVWYCILTWGKEEDELSEAVPSSIKRAGEEIT